MGGKLKSRMNATQFLGYTWNQKNLKQESQNWVFYMFCMSLLQTFPQNFEFKRWIPLEKIKVADISIILERSQKCVTGKIVLKMLGKNQNGTTELP